MRARGGSRMPPPMIVATNEWRSLPDSLEGVRSVGAVKPVLIYGRQRLRGTAALQASIDHRCHKRMALIGRFPGGRPLRRRRERVLISANRGCEGPHLQELAVAFRDGRSRPGQTGPDLEISFAESLPWSPSSRRIESCPKGQLSRALHTH
jgi:hypothetical protein